MTRYPYCRETINLIRAGYSAAALGWDENFYRRVCRDHGIDPAAAPVIAKAQALPKSIAIYCAPIKRPPAIKASKPAREVDPEALPPSNQRCVYDSNSRRASRGNASVILADGQGAVFAILAALPKGARVSGPVIAGRLSISDTSISARIGNLKQAIKPLGLTIHALRARQRSGFWIADARDEQHIDVVLV
jgi:biotin operon repressor